MSQTGWSGVKTTPPEVFFKITQYWHGPKASADFSRTNI